MSEIASALGTLARKVGEAGKAGADSLSGSQKKSETNSGDNLKGVGRKVGTLAKRVMKGSSGGTGAKSGSGKDTGITMNKSQGNGKVV